MMPDVNYNQYNTSLSQSKKWLSPARGLDDTLKALWLETQECLHPDYKYPTSLQDSARAILKEQSQEKNQNAES